MRKALERLLVLISAKLESANRLYAEYASSDLNADIKTYLCEAKKQDILFWERVGLPYYEKLRNLDLVEALPTLTPIKKEIRILKEEDDGKDFMIWNHSKVTY